ncbi:hypothetical protein [Aneurinibacillus aneurinilyticus]|uniref:Uncharacterized protein n=1 Tax=Aneurinibacillus aneurinilyticus ATCC 12856 TaxID=649747 RepID=U1YHG7_ANEAE|nr:hypothetical protein [Aneurinibacillus aneurinilyticus]ERI10216.1 hypothetical protein HMPREF0083_01660 [Aneurinibacillus aneurinilyticus ATCC 12856]MED0705931.1 hypothetical protein [Aneurinibacillus aneurinilyticus]MED0722680.1 hypothetical protein [Aneurinibacillus aneurinilyticus]MED0731400.1 hypothetical protein [Aneurinibacillus aneurinilyticus]MED0740156.1 hypothetical protein [Aneurinibacillus aneurinilyticus]
MDQAYLERAAHDLYTRASTVVLNGERTIPIQQVQQTENQVIIQTTGIHNIKQITSIRLLDEQGGLITERKVNIPVLDEQTLLFTFQFEVKGGTTSGV